MRAMLRHDARALHALWDDLEAGEMYECRPLEVPVDPRFLVEPVPNYRNDPMSSRICRTFVLRDKYSAGVARIPVHASYQKTVNRSRRFGHGYLIFVGDAHAHLLSNVACFGLEYFLQLLEFLSHVEFPPAD